MDWITTRDDHRKVIRIGIPADQVSRLELQPNDLLEDFVVQKDGRIRFLDSGLELTRNRTRISEKSCNGFGKTVRNRKRSVDGNLVSAPPTIVEGIVRLPSPSGPGTVFFVSQTGDGLQLQRLFLPARDVSALNIQNGNYVTGTVTSVHGLLTLLPGAVSKPPASRKLPTGPLLPDSSKGCLRACDVTGRLRAAEKPD